MSLFDDIGNALSYVVSAEGNALTTTVNAVVDTLIVPLILLLVYSIVFFGKPWQKPRV